MASVAVRGKPVSDSRTSTVTRTLLQPPAMWTVILHDDDFTPMAFVVQVLQQIFAKSEREATALMLRVHTQARASVGRYTKEVALTKVLLTRDAAARQGHPLLATAEVV